ncbi:hypothetical protein B0H10DRAFT_2235739 [Mycena sp. CBHHK59/15]|nr:hypothetical protein B0H10DRAFT_2235739 [Mycena sp. CBHHK59/15]
MPLLELPDCETQLNVGVDSMDPNVAKSLHFTPHNMTSSQLVVNEQMQVPKDRQMFLAAVREDHFCIEIPATGPAMNAALLLRQGIRTLGTSLFSLAQFAEDPDYHTEVRAHANLKLWPNSEDPALEHSIPPASSQHEGMACSEMGMHRATISAQVVADLCKMPATPSPSVSILSLSLFRAHVASSIP